MPAVAVSPLPDEPAATLDRIELSIVMPCLNEAETLAVCIKKARAFLDTHGIAGEVIVADNGSTDGSQQIANAMGARIVAIPVRGYGAALAGGIDAARGTFVAMGDADDSYDFGSLLPFVERLRGGADLVMGNRFLGGIAPGAMPLLHRFLGNPLLSLLGRAFFGTPVGDFHCGLRAFRRDRALALGLTSPGMEFASEMVVKASIAGFAIAEVPTTLVPDGRSRPPHLRTWRDGWRHLRFLLLYAPRFLFLYPGLALLFAGLGATAMLATGDVAMGGVAFGVHTMIFATMAALIGAQMVGLAVLARLFGIRTGMWPESRGMRRVRGSFTVERGCIVGALSLLAGLAGGVTATMVWAQAGFGPLVTGELMRLTIPSMLLGCLGVQIAATSFFAGLLDQPQDIRPTV
ncbi:glycosyltransferase family 2 protein [Sphingomonas sp. SAFR-052]|uniref:glycosyltransferase family 2 protein n=1 Tax=Sphingomonas sp. SAFR-052 TaxID=3436867 RepID=UPI003F7E5A01